MLKKIIIYILIFCLFTTACQNPDRKIKRFLLDFDKNYDILFEKDKFDDTEYFYTYNNNSYKIYLNNDWELFSSLVQDWNKIKRQIYYEMVIITGDIEFDKNLFNFFYYLNNSVAAGEQYYLKSGQFLNTWIKQNIVRNNYGDDGLDELEETFLIDKKSNSSLIAEIEELRYLFIEEGKRVESYWINIHNRINDIEIADKLYWKLGSDFNIMNIIFSLH